MVQDGGEKPATVEEGYLLVSGLLDPSRDIQLVLMSTTACSMAWRKGWWRKGSWAARRTSCRSPTG
ncbi:MAG: hypothetical protein U0841_28400 [Chloroflexia bacterium]